MLPQVIFPALTMCGTNQKCLGGDDSYVTFKARDNQSQNGQYTVYVFNAYEDVMERIKRMKLKTGSQITIFAEMKTYIDKQNNQKFSFTVTKIDYIKTSNFNKNKDEHINEESKDELPEKNVKDNSTKPTNFNVSNNKKSSFITGELDLDAFQNMFH